MNAVNYSCNQVKEIMTFLNKVEAILEYEFIAIGFSMGGCVLMNLLNWCKGFIEKLSVAVTYNSPLLGGNFFKIV